MINFNSSIIYKVLPQKKSNYQIMLVNKKATKQDIKKELLLFFPNITIDKIQTLNQPDKIKQKRVYITPKGLDRKGEKIVSKKKSKTVRTPIQRFKKAYVRTSAVLQINK